MRRVLLLAIGAVLLAACATPRTGGRFAGPYIGLNGGVARSP